MQLYKNLVKPADFRKLSRHSDRILSTIDIQDHDYRMFTWLTFGEAHLNQHSTLKTWTLKAYLLDATDVEHDSAYLFQMDLIGVEFSSIGYGQTQLGGYIHPRDVHTFRVPPADYDPFKDATVCSGSKRHCKWGEGKKHPITKYIPDANSELFDILRGARVEIRTGAVLPKEG